MNMRTLLLVGVVALVALPFGMQAQEPGHPETVIPIAKGPFNFPAGYQTPWDKIDIRVIEVLLGHRKLDTTAVYTRVALRTIRAVTSPLALLEAPSPP